MSDIQEFDLYVECPHCEAENYETAFFGTKAIAQKEGNYSEKKEF